MDYKGQKLSEQIYLVLIPAVGSVAWVFGYVAQDFKTTFYGWLAGLVLAMLICVPDWPIFNRNPTPWLEEIPSARKQTCGGRRRRRGRGARFEGEGEEEEGGEAVVSDVGIPAPGEHPQKPDGEGRLSSRPGPSSPPGRRGRPHDLFADLACTGG